MAYGDTDRNKAASEALEYQRKKRKKKQPTPKTLKAKKKVNKKTKHLVKKEGKDPKQAYAISLRIHSDGKRA